LKAISKADEMIHLETGDQENHKGNERMGIHGLGKENACEDINLIT
jgi:hypothetical protein